MTVSPPCRSFSEPSRMFRVPLDKRIGEYIERVVEEGDPTPIPAQPTFAERLLEEQENDWFAKTTGGKKRPSGDIVPRRRLPEEEVRCLVQTLSIGYRTAKLRGTLTVHQ